MTKWRGARVAALALMLPACDLAARQPSVDGAALVRDLEILAADNMEGRLAGTPGGARAREYIVRRFREVGIRPIGSSYERPFTFRTARDSSARSGVNVIGTIPGKRNEGPWLVITAHYDHLGIRGGEVFNGADDNASGVAVLLAVAASFTQLPPEHSMLFAALDAEESGLQGARALLRAAPVPVGSMALNVNLDMVARDETNRLFASGTHHYPFLRRYLSNVASPPVRLLFGHDVPGARDEEDWTRDSDHFVFHQAGIPFVYFGVEGTGHHHKPTDDPDTVPKEFFVGAVRTIVAAVQRFDANLTDIQARR